jgi:hypothetical protein
MRRVLFPVLALCAIIWMLFPNSANAWFDETHVAVAKAAGYFKWFNAVGPDMMKEKMGKKEEHNHFAINPRGTVVTSEMVLGQVERYNKIDSGGHLYGAIIVSFRDYLKIRGRGKYGEYHLAFCAHYVADLSQPLHNTDHNLFNLAYHQDMDGIVNDEVLNNPDKIKVYSISITSEEALAKEIARLANLSMILGYTLEDEKRLLTKEEAYQQLSHSASLFKAILDYVAGANKPGK